MLNKVLGLLGMAMFFAISIVHAQTETKVLEEEMITEKKIEISKLEKEKDTEKEKTEDKKKDLSGLKYRFIQDNGFFVDEAFTQEEGYVQHTFKFARSFNGSWQSVVEEEIPLGSEKQQISFTASMNGFNSDNNGKVRGFGDLQIEYRYRLIGGESSRVTISPTFGVSFPTGSYRNELGSGGFGTEISLPVSIAFSNRFMTNSNVGVSFTPRARNTEGNQAFVTNFEIGQSFVWFARPKLNALVELVWERNKEVIGQKLTKAENEFFVSPGIRWGYTFKNGLTIVPGIAIPIGIGPSKGEKSIFFYLSFEHPFKKNLE